MKVNLILKELHGTPLDPEIADVVKALRTLKIPTQYSCAGHAETAFTTPHIDIYENKDHINYKNYSPKMRIKKERWIKKNIAIQTKLIKLLTAFYKSRKVPYQYQLSIHSQIDWCWFRLRSIGVDQLQNMPISKRRKELKIYQKELQAFGKFLLK